VNAEPHCVEVRTEALDPRQEILRAVRVGKAARWSAVVVLNVADQLG
jgi:hypothetical protein